MALSNLTQLTQAQYRALTITPFASNPSVSKTGNPDTRITINPAGWVGTDVMAFTIADQATVDSNVTIQNASTDVMNASIIGGGSPTANTTYWTVNMGAGASGTNWQVSFNVNVGTTTTGTWIFVKSKTIDPTKKY